MMFFNTRRLGRRLTAVAMKPDAGDALGRKRHFGRRALGKAERQVGDVRRELAELPDVGLAVDERDRQRRGRLPKAFPRFPCWTESLPLASTDARASDWDASERRHGAVGERNRARAVHQRYRLQGGSRVRGWQVHVSGRVAARAAGSARLSSARRRGSPARAASSGGAWRRGRTVTRRTESDRAAAATGGCAAAG